MIIWLSWCNKNGYDYNKSVAFILVFAIVITNTSTVFAENVEAYNLYLESASKNEEEKLLKDIYNGLGAETKEIFLEEIKGDFELQKLHAVSAGFVADTADGPLPFSDAVLLSASVALTVTLAIYCNSVASKWPQIVRVFERQFSDSISTVRRVLAKVKGDTESKVEKEYQKDKKKRYKNW